jgi:cyclic beta-1,2-glucan synthetase
MENGIGGFTPDGREYVIVLEGERETPLPWSNILANPEFGTMLSESGASYTWAGNSRENRLTPFANDPISDPTGEAIFLRDEDAMTVWGATPGPLDRTSDSGRWVIRHGAGVTRFQHAVDGLEQDMAVCVPPDDAVKLSLLTLKNTSSETRRLSIFGYVEWVLGPPRYGERRFVVPEVDASTGALVARNAYNTDFKDRVAFWHATEAPTSFTCDRADFIGRNRTLAAPAGLLRERLGGRTGPGLDPCAALQIRIDIPPGEVRRVAFALGQGSDASHCATLADRYSRLEAVDDAIACSGRFWDEVLGAVQVHTPDDSFDLLVNRWLLYQALSCRVWARSGPYQPGGAFGFRDQLQDVLALLYSRPEPLSLTPSAGCLAAIRRGRTSSTGGIRPAAAEFEPDVPMTCSGCRMPRRRTSNERGINRCSMRSCRFWRGRHSSRTTVSCTACRRSPCTPRRCSSMGLAPSIVRSSMVHTVFRSSAQATGTMG